MVTYPNVLEDASRQAGEGKSEGMQFALPLHRRRRPGKAGISAALVASSDEGVLQAVAEIVLQCGLVTHLAVTAGESRRILERYPVSLVVCDDRLTDTSWENILKETARLQPETPVIVVSPAGGWPECLQAINAGAFDFLAVPLAREDFRRAIREALATRRRHIPKAEKRVFAAVGETS